MLTLNQQFCHYILLGIQKYLLQHRLKIAKQRLVENRMAITEIAHSLGYPDVRHFSTLFRKHTGKTPTAFRKDKGTMFLG